LKSRNKIKKYGNKYAGQYPKMKDGQNGVGLFVNALPSDNVHQMLEAWTKTVLDGQKEWQAAIEELQKKETQHFKRLKKMEPYRDRLLIMADNET
jgi:hypothetical protein